MSVPETARIPVQSSLIASIGYSVHATLELQFHSGALYRYFAVPHVIVAELLAAESKGAYFNRKIRSRFPYQRLA
jgi:KTSC domain-containing protein